MFRSNSRVESYSRAVRMGTHASREPVGAVFRGSERGTGGEQRSPEAAKRERVRRPKDSAVRQASLPRISSSDVT